MHDENLDGLAADLRNADEKMLQEIIREAELFLGSQLTAGVAADQRAVTFASVLSAAAAVLIGGYVAAATSGNPMPGLGWVVLSHIPLFAGCRSLRDNFVSAHGLALPWKQSAPLARRCKRERFIA